MRTLVSTMHLPFLKALVAAISASVLAIGVALAPAHHAHRSRTASQTSSLQADGLQFLGQLVAGNVKPDQALKQCWTDDVSAVAHSLGLTDDALAENDRAISPIAARALLNALGNS